MDAEGEGTAPRNDRHGIPTLPVTWKFVGTIHLTC
jgi:hypothetical protein